MTEAQVNEMLAQYRHCAGRCEYIEIRIGILRRWIEQDHSHALRERAYASVPSDGMPRGSAVGNPTERIGIAVADRDGETYIRSMEREIAELTREYEQKIVTVRCVQAWLKGLTQRERWIVSESVFDGKTYRRLLASYHEAFGDFLTRDSLRALRKTALRKIYAMAG